MAKKTVSFQFYPDDFVGGTFEFTDAEVGVYVRLMCKQSAVGRMDSVIVDRIAGDAWPIVKQKFIQDESGLWYNERLESELIRRRDYVKSRSENRSNDISKTYDNHMTNHMGDGKGNGNGNGKGKGKGNGKTRVVEIEQPLVYPFTDSGFMEMWEVWREYKREQFKFNYKPRGEQAALKSIGDLSGGNMEAAIKIIEQSMANGWKGFFALDKTTIHAGDRITAQSAERIGQYMEDKYKNKNF